MIELGRIVKDKVTGFTGIAIARLEFLNGCLQFLVQPKVVTPKKGEAMTHPAAVYIDVEQLVVVGKSKVELNEREEPSGGIRCYP